MGSTTISRRKFLATASRFGMLGVFASLGSIFVSGCDRRSSSPPGDASITSALPKLPEGSRDFDLINTMLQLENRAAALAAEVRQGRRLGERASALVDKVLQGHRSHAALLERVVHEAGATPDPPRHRYALPTPLGDERRALGVLLEDEKNLVAKYAEGLGMLETFALSRTLGSLLFSDKTYVAALERLLDRCPDPTFAFEEFDPSSSKLALSAPTTSTPAPSRTPLSTSLLLRALESFETSAEQVLAVIVQSLTSTLEVLSEKATSTNQGVVPSSRAAGPSLDVVGYCLLKKDTEGRIRGPASEDLPDAVSVLTRGDQASEDSVKVVAAAVSIVQAMSDGHAHRARYWSDRAGEEGRAEEPKPVQLLLRELPLELSPTAAGIEEDRVIKRDSSAELPASEIFQAVVDTEIKTARALTVAASNFTSDRLRSSIASALAAVASATSRLVGLATGEEFVVEGV